MNENQLKQKEQCPYFKFDDWGVCKYQYDWEEDVCENNCLKNYDKEGIMHEM